MIDLDPLEDARHDRPRMRRAVALGFQPAGLAAQEGLGSDLLDSPVDGHLCGRLEQTETDLDALLVGIADPGDDHKVGVRHRSVCRRCAQFGEDRADDLLALVVQAAFARPALLARDGHEGADVLTSRQECVQPTLDARRAGGMAYGCPFGATRRRVLARWLQLGGVLVDGGPVALLGRPLGQREDQIVSAPCLRPQGFRQPIEVGDAVVEPQRAIGIMACVASGHLELQRPLGPRLGEIGLRYGGLPAKAHILDQITLADQDLADDADVLAEREPGAYGEA